MEFYKKELITWAEKHNDPVFSKLTALDPSWKQYCEERSTPLPRIIDKCTFIGDKIYNSIQYLPLTFKVFIGGHFGTSYKVELYGEDITYSVLDQGNHFKMSKWINPSTKRWKNSNR